MLEILTQLIPVFVYFGLGLLLRFQGVAERSHGEFLLRFVFFVTLPLLILTTVSNLHFTLEKAVLPLLNIGVNLGCMALTLLLIALRKLERATAGTMLVNTTIVNNGFMFPFILAVYGADGFADAVLFDFGNALMMATVVYAMAFHYGGEANQNRWMMLVRILKSPMIWFLLLSVILSLTGTPLPTKIQTIVVPLAQMTGPLILIALGIFFSLKMTKLSLMFQIVFIRMGFGLLCGMGLATLAGLSGETFVVVSLCSAAPIGFNALTFCSMAKLDTELSASAVPASLLAGLIYIPLLMYFFGS